MSRSNDELFSLTSACARVCARIKVCYFNKQNSKYSPSLSSKNQSVIHPVKNKEHNQIKRLFAAYKRQDNPSTNSMTR